MKELYDLLAHANVIAKEGLETRSKIQSLSDAWKEKLNKAAEKAKTVAEKGAIYSERELLP